MALQSRGSNGAAPSHGSVAESRGGRALLGVAGIGAVLVLLGVGLTLASSRGVAGPSGPGVQRSTPGPAPSARSLVSTEPVAPASASPQTTDRLEDVVAARPLPSLPLSAATPGPVSTRDPGPVIVVPECPDTGPAGVQTGCPHTRAGAMAQLIAIDQAALQSGTMAGAREVIAAWAMPGGPTTTSWSGVHAMASLLSPQRGHRRSAGLTAGMSGLPVALTPVMGLFKGHVGDDFVVPCVGYELAVTLTETARVGVSDCQRMTWVVSGAAGRWMIGTGLEPAQAPNVWPDTDDAIDAGFTDLAWQP